MQMCRQLVSGAALALFACSSNVDQRSESNGIVGSDSAIAEGAETGETGNGESGNGESGNGESGNGAPDDGETGDGDPGDPGDGEPNGSDLKFDLGIVPDTPKQAGCNAVDFLFVIDNSGSMLEQQQQLLSSFPGFIQAIEDTLADVDSIHLGVVTSDAYQSNQPGCQQLGALVTQTNQGPCGPFVEGNRFVTEADDIAARFTCMAQVGTTGSWLEMPVSAAIEAVSPQLAQPMACNEGFLRPNAVLVVVIITDDPPWDPDFDDANLSADTSGWTEAIIAAKSNNPEALVVIGFIPWQDLSCTQVDSPNLIGFVESFGDQGILASVCTDDYGPIFDAAIETISETCTNFAG